MGLVQRRIGVQLALALILASAGPLVGAALLVSSLIESSLMRQAESTQKRVLEACASLIEDYASSAEAKLGTIAQLVAKEKAGVDPRAEAQAREALARKLDAALRPSDTFLQLSYFSYQKGQTEVYSYRPKAEGTTIVVASKPPPIPLAHPLITRPPFTSTDVELDGSDPFFWSSVPVGPEGSAAGVLVARVNLNPVRRTLTSLAGEQAQIILQDSSGGKISSARSEAATDVIATRGTVSGRKWSLEFRQPRGIALAGLDQARRQALLWLALALLTALALAAFLTARIVTPVRALSRAARQMGHGELSARSNVSREDELGELARTFDQMAESLQKLDELKSDFVSHVSHELRSPLTSIKVSIANLRDGTMGPLAESQLIVLGRVAADLERLIRMVNELLEAARLEAGQAQLQKEVCDLEGIVRQVLETARPLTHEKGVELELRGSVTRVSVDPLKLHRAVLNLVDNAIRFSPSGGRVLVEVGVEKNLAVCRVSDSGPGIDPARIERLFEKFNNEPGPKGEKRAGAGLGLWISKKIIELNGGSIRAENRPEGGARFTLSIPEA
jgi:signal transduction histidine kinase